MADSMLPMARSLRPRNKRKPEQTYKDLDDEDEEEEILKDAAEPKAKEAKADTHVVRNKGNACKTKITPTKASLIAEKKQSAEEKKEQGDGTIKTKENGKGGGGEVPTKASLLPPPPPPPPVPLPPPPVSLPPTAVPMEKPKKKKKEPEGPPLSVEEEKLLQTDVLTLLKRFAPKYYVPLQKTWSIPKSQLTANQTQSAN